MKMKAYISRYYTTREWIPYLTIAAVIGAIPAVMIRIRGGLIDCAANGVTTGGFNSFFWFLAIFCVLSFLNTVCSAVLLRMAEKHKICQAAKLDIIRLDKASRVAFHITETQQFHSLWQKASKASELDGQLYQALGDIVNLSVKLAASLFVLWLMDQWTAIGIAILLIVGILLNRKLAQKTEGFWVKYIENMRRTDYFSSLLLQREFAAERKIFSFDDEIDHRYTDSFTKAKRENTRLGRGRFQIETVMQLLFACYSVIVVLLLLRPLMSGRITIGLFTSAFYAAAGLQQSCKQMYASVFDLVGSMKQMSSFFSFLELDEDEKAETIQMDDSIRNIVFHDVTFTYPGTDKPILKHVSFQLEPGKHYALVGENGCGKSTLVKLLVGLYTPDSGAVLINGMPVHTLSLAQRRRLYSVVFQDYYRYPITVRENVSLCADASLNNGTLDAVFDQLDFRPMAVNKETGYDSDLMPLHKTGAGLSGGEWQKMAVARCVLSPAPVAILDEPNAALDPVAEAAIYKAYHHLLSKRTTLFISHRLGSVRMADEILVLKDGALIAKAPHEELMRECGYYAELFNTQKGLYDEQ
ncbi:MAG: ABC transporter ATP-binding protein [Christensenellaceae bacterium]|nr:ABC transporter ATP-binding protein [Christensenellaceae bacterium]